MSMALNVPIKIGWQLFGLQEQILRARCAQFNSEHTVPYAGEKMLRLFFRTKSRNAHLGIANPLGEGAETSEKRSRAMVYNKERDRADRDTTSRLRYMKEHARIIATNDYPVSPYLAAGVISARECVRAALEFLGSKKVQTNRDSGVGMWIQEIGNYLRGLPSLPYLGITSSQRGVISTHMFLPPFHAFRWGAHSKRSTQACSGSQIQNISTLGGRAGRECP